MYQGKPELLGLLLVQHKNDRCGQMGHNYCSLFDNSGDQSSPSRAQADDCFIASFLSLASEACIMRPN